MPERLRAFISAVKPQFIQKAVQFNIKCEDGYDPNLCTNIAVFVPKLRPKYIQPCVMVNISNGRSSVLMRLYDPQDLKNICTKILAMLDTDLFKDRWQRIKDHSDRLIDGQLNVYDPLYFKS